MSGAGNPLDCDYRDPKHVERYRKLVVVRNPDGSTEGATRATYRGMIRATSPPPFRFNPAGFPI
jgi:hypothetical protein